jgi:glycosyltransferase involved in cell wall biosynthesis
MTERGKQQRHRLNAVQCASVAQHAQLIDGGVAQHSSQSPWVTQGGGELTEREDPFIRGGRDGRPVERKVDCEAHPGVTIWAVRRLLLVTHRSIEQDGGPAARWRAFARYLPEHGWEVEVLSSVQRVGASEFDSRASRAVTVRAAVMARVGRSTEPIFRLAGVRPDALPLSMLWVARGALLVRERIRRGDHDVVLASGPPLAGPLAARLGVRSRAPLVVELRDLWAGSPAFDAGGEILSRVEDWLLGDALRVVACTPEAVADLRLRHPRLAERVVEISNGFDPEIRAIARRSEEGRDANEGDGSSRTLTLLHSGTLTPARPITPLVNALADPRLAGAFRLVLHGYLSPATRAEVEQARRERNVSIDVLAPSPWEEAVALIAEADACLITQARDAGDATAIASKVYEYLALGKPVLCLTDGGASEALLRRLGADALCAHLDEPEAIVGALLRLRDRAPSAVPAERLEPYSRRALAARMAALLEEVAVAG